MTRSMLVVCHLGRGDAVKASHTVIGMLHAQGITPVVAKEAHAALSHESEAPLAVLGEDIPASEVELGIVLGGDGTILWAAELLRGSGAPLLGINLGHVGFLAESEPEDLPVTIERAIDKSYDVEGRLTLDVVVEQAGAEVYRTWALNEATVEKAGGARMVELVLEVDSRPVSSFGGDGVVLSTPTGSTAYSFSAGGPIVWPEVDALLMVPLSAHALFARPLVVAPTSVLAVEVASRTEHQAILWCDGRRGVDLSPGSRVTVTRSREPVLLARLHPDPFSDRLVKKFSLPVAGWRGPGETRS